MSKKFPALTIGTIKPEECIAEYIYLPKVAHLDDSAIEAMIDFRLVKPLIFNKTELMVAARRAMELSDLHVALVLDSHKQLVGLISLEQILSEKSVKMVESRRVERKDVQLSSMMTPLKNVAVVDFAKLKYAKVGHVVSTLKTIQRYYILVIEHDVNNEKSIVRGIFLASHLSRLLDEHITIDPLQAKPLLELIKKLK